METTSKAGGWSRVQFDADAAALEVGIENYGQAASLLTHGVRISLASFAIRS